MHSACHFLKNLSWMSILGLVLAGFLGSGRSASIVCLSVLLASSLLIFMFPQQKARFELDKLYEDDFIQIPDEEIFHRFEDESITDKKAAGKNADDEEEEEQIDDYLTGSSPVILSENECPGRSSTIEDSEVNMWQFQDNMSQSPDFSDGSISDEDSLIEISLPGGNYIGDEKKAKEGEPKFNPEKKLEDFVAGSFLKQHGWMDVLAVNDINEENLIEIDLSMGSIKCSRFEIEA